MVLWFIFLIVNFIIPVFIIRKGRKLSLEQENTMAGQIWKLTGYMLLPATLIITLLCLGRPLRTQVILTGCVLLMQVIILVFLNASARSLADRQ